MLLHQLLKPSHDKNYFKSYQKYRTLLTNIHAEVFKENYSYDYNLLWNIFKTGWINGLTEKPSIVAH